MPLPLGPVTADSAVVQRPAIGGDASMARRIGGIKTIDEARSLFQKKMDKENLGKIGKIQNEEALLKVANAIAMCDPESAWVDTGSPEDVEQIRKWSVEKGEEAPLAMDGHTIHYDLAKEQARLEDIIQATDAHNLDHRLEVIQRRSQYELDRAENATP